MLWVLQQAEEAGEALQRHRAVSEGLEQMLAASVVRMQTLVALAVLELLI